MTVVRRLIGDVVAGLRADLASATTRADALEVENAKLRRRVTELKGELGTRPPAPPAEVPWWDRAAAPREAAPVAVEEEPL